MSRPNTPNSRGKITVGVGKKSAAYSLYKPKP